MCRPRSGILPLNLEDFESTCIVREPLMVVLPRGHSLARRRQLHAAELTGERVIWLARDLVPDIFDHTADLFQRAGYVLHVRDEVQSQSQKRSASSSRAVASRS
jgi:DNA-binding transcriptional LysR family regulator